MFHCLGILKKMEWNGTFGTHSTLFHHFPSFLLPPNWEVWNGISHINYIITYLPLNKQAASCWYAIFSLHQFRYFLFIWLLTGLISLNIFVFFLLLLLSLVHILFHAFIFFHAILSLLLSVGTNRYPACLQIFFHLYPVFYFIYII